MTPRVKRFFAVFMPFLRGVLLNARQGDAALSLVLAAAVAIRGLAQLVGLDEDRLRHALVGVDARRKWRGVGELERDVSFPLGLERRDIDDDAAAGVRGLAQADGEHLARYAEVLHGAGQGERVRRDDAHLTLEVD